MLTAGLLAALAAGAQAKDRVFPVAARPVPGDVYPDRVVRFPGGVHTRQADALANMPDALASLTAEGFVVASLEYRLSRQASFPAQLQAVDATFDVFHGMLDTPRR